MLLVGSAFAVVRHSDNEHRTSNALPPATHTRSGDLVAISADKGMVTRSHAQHWYPFNRRAISNVTATDNKMLLLRPDVHTARRCVQSKTTVIIKYMSRYRAEEAANLIASIRKYYPVIRILIGDDTQNPGTPYEILSQWANDSNTELVLLPEDEGTAAGRNILVQMVKTPLLLLLDDDYVFTNNTRLEQFVGLLLTNPDVSLVGGGISKAKRLDDPTPGYESYGLVRV